MKILWPIVMSINFIGIFIPPLDLRSVGSAFFFIGSVFFVLHHFGGRL